MASQHSDNSIRNPVEWVGAQLVLTFRAIGAIGRSVHHIQETLHVPAPAVRKIRIADVREALSKGLEDFGAFRTDVIFLCVVYPVVGLILGRLAFGDQTLPLLFPLASGFALVGPVAALGLYEMSKRREQGLPVTWATAFDVLRAPAVGGIAALSLLLTGLFLLWMWAAWKISMATLGPEQPDSIAAFVRDVLTTEAGHMMIIVGMGVGFLFALVAMALSVASFPLLLDRDVGLDTAIITSVRAVAANPVPMAVWGLIVAGGLAIGSIPLFLGLVVIIPIFGHATWHLYRRLVVS